MTTKVWQQCIQCGTMTTANFCSQHCMDEWLADEENARLFDQAEEQRNLTEDFRCPCGSPTCDGTCETASELRKREADYDELPF